MTVPVAAGIPQRCERRARNGWHRLYDVAGGREEKHVRDTTAPTIPLEDLRYLLAEALKKGWQ